MAVAPSSAAPVPTDRAAAHARTEHFRDDAAFVRRYRWLILAGLITAAIMEVLDTTAMTAPGSEALIQTYEPGDDSTSAPLRDLSLGR